MDIFDSLSKIQKESLRTEASQYKQAATEYMLQGFDEDGITELLCIDGCSHEVAKELTVATLSQRPDSYNENSRPESYIDVRAQVEETIKFADTGEIQRYFDKQADRKYVSLGSHMLVARDTPSKIYLDEVHAELRPMIEGLIIANNTLACDDETGMVTGNTEKEQSEYKLFGIWPIALIQQQERKRKVEEELMSAYRPE